MSRPRLIKVVSLRQMLYSICDDGKRTKKVFITSHSREDVTTSPTIILRIPWRDEKQKQTRHTPPQTRWRTFRFKRRKEAINNVTLVGEEEENRFSFLPCWMPCRWRNDAFVSSPTGPNTSPALPTFPRPDGCMFHLLRNGWKKKSHF